MSQTMTLMEFRDELLESLRAQFKAKVRAIIDQHGAYIYQQIDAPRLDGFLRDLANNLASAFSDGLEVK
jgi:hypothetical protein